VRFVELKITQFIYGSVYSVDDLVVKSRRESEASLCSKSIQTGCQVHPKYKLALGIKWPRRVAHRSLPLVSRLRMSETIHLHPPYSFMECSEINLALLHEVDLDKGI